MPFCPSSPWSSKLTAELIFVSFLEITMTAPSNRCHRKSINTHTSLHKNCHKHCYPTVLSKHTWWKRRVEGLLRMKMRMATWLALEIWHGDLRCLLKCCSRQLNLANQDKNKKIKIKFDIIFASIFMVFPWTDIFTIRFPQCAQSIDSCNCILWMNRKIVNGR